MAKESAPSGGKKPAARGDAAAGLDARLARMDRDLLKLLNQRARLAAKKTRRKSADVQIQDAELAAVVAANSGPLSADCLRAIFRELVGGCRALENHVRVAYLGPAYSYSHLATITRFGTSVDQVPVGSIAAVFEEVNRGHVAYGLVPIENSTDGRIADTLDMFTRLKVRICGEVQLRIHHTLLGKGTRGDITEVYSRPQALSQCRNWLSRHIPAARIVEVTSTSTAAQLALDKPGAAAIASAQAGVHYGLTVLAEKIEDNQANLTRFAVIGLEAAARTGHDKTAAMFEVADRPGSLADSMAIFKRFRLNLSWIESFPISRPEGGYLFFIEMDGHQSDTKVKQALELLGEQAIRLEVIGSYPKSEVLGN